ncbi:M23 family metallopeptidase [Streptomyces sp. NPDC090445]|uniref:M23 family metallopeptidase n=1 Tax=Streptomyces sp. NPDC090445 TaxID=3365963 RepID=UPI0037F14D53
MSAKRISTRRTRLAIGATALGATLALGAGATAAFAATPAALPAAQSSTSAASAKAGAWQKPLAAYTLSATYGKGGNLWSAKHSGQDFAVPVGTAVTSVSAGTVVKAGPNGGGDGPAYGNAIVVKHGNNTYSQYAHLAKIQVKIGQKVAKGAQIGLSGNTGNSTGPHLHFEIRTTPNYGSSVNPVAFLRAAGVTL